MPIRRKVFLINKPFQLRFAFYVCSWLVGLSLVYPLIISNVFDYFLRYMASDPMGPSLLTLENTRTDLLTLLGLLQAILLSVTLIISIFMSHRIAGPLYKLNLFMKENASGNLRPTISFRKNDYFTELVDSYNQMMKTILAGFHKKNINIQLAIEKIEKIIPAAPPQVQAELENALIALRDSQDPMQPQTQSPAKPQDQISNKG